MVIGDVRATLTQLIALLTAVSAQVQTLSTALATLTQAIQAGQQQAHQDHLAAVALLTQIAQHTTPPGRGK